jgi:dipeptidyl aminopeptidase/acylaminoacyl peptidase
LRLRRLISRSQSIAGEILSMTRSSIVLTLGAVACCWATLRASQNPAAELIAPLPIDAAIDRYAFAHPTTPPLALSPDGRQVAYLVRAAYRDGAPTDYSRIHGKTGMLSGTDGVLLMVTDVQQRTTRKITEEGRTAWSPVWSPDGKSLAFYYDGEGYAAIWTWSLATGKLERAAPVRARPVDTFCLYWTPDGEHIVGLLETLNQGEDDPKRTEKLSPQSAVANGTGSTVKVYESNVEDKASTDQSDFTPDENSQQRLAADIALISPRTHTARRLVVAAGVRCLWLSPDGTKVAFTRVAGYHAQDIHRYMFDVAVVDLSNASVRVVAPHARLSIMGTTVSWSPDSRSLAYITMEVHFRVDEQIADGQCYVVPADGSAPPRRVTEVPHPHLGHTFRAPVWSNDGTRIYAADANALWELDIPGRKARRIGGVPGKTLAHIVTPSHGGRSWSADRNHSITIATRDTVSKAEGLYRMSLESGAATRLWEGSLFLTPKHIPQCDTAVNSPAVACVTESFQQSPNIWIGTSDLRDFHRLTDLNPAIDRIALGKNQLVEWHDDDGNAVQGALFLPPDHRDGVRHPLLVTTYPDQRFSDAINRFDGRPVVGVIQLLTTRGYAVLCADLPLRGRGLIRDITMTVLPGINKMVEMGVADPDRVGVMGESFGGYAVMALITHSTRFKAAIEMMGFSDLTSIYGSFRGATAHFAISLFEAKQDVGGTPWEYRERYIENSPLYYLDRVDTPLLMLHGDEDSSVDPHVAGETFVGLRRLGKRVVYATYAQEGHSMTTRANELDLLTRTIAWLDDHLELTRSQSATTVSR